MKHKNISTIYIIPPHWQDTGSWNLSSCKTRTYLFYIVNIMGVDVLVTQGAMSLTTICMILTMLNWNNSVPACQGLKLPGEEHSRSSWEQTYHLFDSEKKKKKGNMHFVHCIFIDQSTHWSLKKMAGIFQTIFSDIFFNENMNFRRKKCRNMFQVV